MRKTSVLLAVLMLAVAAASASAAGVRAPHVWGLHFPSDGYRAAKASERPAMTKAAAPRRKYGQLWGVTRPFAWRIGRKDDSWGYVCGKGADSDSRWGVPLRRVRGVWRLETQSSGAPQNAAYMCGAYD